MPKLANLEISRENETVSKAFARSKYMISVEQPLSMAKVMSSTTSISCVVTECCCRKPCWHSGKILLASINCCNLSEMIFSSILEEEQSKDIGRKSIGREGLGFLGIG